MKPYVKYLVSSELENILNTAVQKCLGNEAVGRIHAVYAENSKDSAFARCNTVREDLKEFSFIIVFYPGFLTDDILQISRSELGREVSLPEMRLGIIAHELAHIINIKGRRTRGHGKEHLEATREYFKRVSDKILVEKMENYKLQEDAVIENSDYYSFFNTVDPLPPIDIWNRIVDNEIVKGSD